MGLCQKVMCYRISSYFTEIDKIFECQLVSSLINAAIADKRTLGITIHRWVKDASLVIIKEL